MTHPLIPPLAAHVALTMLLYVALTVARAPKVWGFGQRPDGSNPGQTVEPRISANLSNQFELPLFFHAACLLLIQSATESPAAILLAWLFVLGRLVHSYVQIMTENIRLRGIVFTINFVATVGLWIIVFRFYQFGTAA